MLKPGKSYINILQAFFKSWKRSYSLIISDQST